MQRTPAIPWHTALALGTLVTAGVGACDGEGPSGRPEALLKRMASCDELRVELEDRVVETLIDSRYGGRGGWLGTDDVAEGAADGDTSGGGDTPSDFSTTNTQEQGVDELDLVKPDVDGTHLFVAQDRGFHIVKAWPAEDTDKLATLPLDGWVQGMFLVDADTAVVFETVDGAAVGLSDDDRWRSVLRMRTIDVSDRTAPVTTRVIDIEGYLADARMIDGRITAVINQWMDLPQDLWEATWDDSVPWPEYPDLQTDDPDAWDAAWEQARSEARDVIRPIVQAELQTVALSELLPAWRTDAGGSFEMVHDCTDLYAPDAVSPLAMLTVASYDPGADELGATGLMSDGWTVYASRENLYVAQSSRWWWGWDDDTVSHIHKFELGGQEPAYVASGEVQGWLYDQFAMSEYQGFLRVVSTDFRTWWGEPEDEDLADPANHVTVLEDDDAGLLEVVGHVDGIAPNEQIQSARMMGEKGYVVTFEQVDPLFVLDLSDPRDPKVTGELKIPGFSAYLHPLGSTHLIGVGMAGLDTGELTGLAINLFDVSDPTNPILQDAFEVSHDGGWAWSEALWDHHAFTYHRDTLTIPAFTERWDDVTQTWEGFSGTISFHVVADAPITEVGRVDHRDLVAQSECLWDRWYDWVEDGQSACDWEYGYWYARIRRSVVIEDVLYTISDYGIKVNELDDPDTEIDRVLFYAR